MDKDLRVQYDTAADIRLIGVASNLNEKVVEHKEHLTPPIGSHEDEEFLTEAELVWYRVRRFMQEPFSEFFGVFIMILFGDGVVAQVVLSNSTKGDYQSISWCWG